MKTGALVPDSMILRLIRNSLTTRGWLHERGSGQTLTLNTIASDLTGAGLPDTLIENDNFFNNRMPANTEVEYDYTDHPDASFILDGFPRNAAQADQLDALVPINLVVSIKTPTEIILDRICNRWIHQASGRTYNLTFNAPKEDGKDDITGEPLTQRDDDKPEVWKARLKQFEDASRELLEHYDKMGVLWTVQGDSSDEISPKLFKEFERRFAE
jgi:adenylate kinase